MINCLQKNSIIRTKEETTDIKDRLENNYECLYVWISFFMNNLGLFINIQLGNRKIIS